MALSLNAADKICCVIICLPFLFSKNAWMQNLLDLSTPHTQILVCKMPFSTKILFEKLTDAELEHGRYKLSLENFTVH